MLRRASFRHSVTMFRSPSPLEESAEILYESSSGDVAPDQAGAVEHVAVESRPSGEPLGNLPPSLLQGNIEEVSIRRSRPVSEVSTRSGGIVLEEQERTRAEYLQAQGFASADERSSNKSAAPSSKTGVPGKVKEIEQRLRVSPQPAVAGVESTPDVTSSQSTDRLARFKVHTSRSRAIETAASSSRAQEDATVPEGSPSSGKFKVRTSFENSRTVEAGNWFTARNSKTSSPQSKPLDALRDSSSSLETAKAVSVERPSRSTSLRIRNKRLPPGYNVPSDALVAAFTAASGGFAGPVAERVLEAAPVRRPIPRAQQVLESTSDSNDRSDRLIWTTAQRSRSTWSHSGDFSSAFRSGIVSQLTLPGSSQVEGGMIEIPKEEDREIKLKLPPGSLDGASRRNSAFLSSRGSVLLAAPEPVVLRPMNAVDTGLVRKQDEESRPWRLKLVLALLWIILTALTIFGISKFAPLHHCPLEMSRGDKKCAPPTLSFKHNWRLEMDVPVILQPFMPSLQVASSGGVRIEDQGLKIDLHGYSDTQNMHMHDRLLVGTLLGNTGQMVSNVTYVGVINDSEDERGAQRLMDQIVREARSGRSVNSAVNVQSRGSNAGLSKAKLLTGRVYLTLCCIGSLAVECTLLAFWLILPLACGVARWAHRCWVGKQRTRCASQNWRERWQREVLLVLRWVLAGALGAAMAGGILVAFWA